MQPLAMKTTKLLLTLPLFGLLLSCELIESYGERHWDLCREWRESVETWNRAQKLPSREFIAWMFKSLDLPLSSLDREPGKHPTTMAKAVE